MNNDITLPVSAENTVVTINETEPQDILEDILQDLGVGSTDEFNAASENIEINSIDNMDALIETIEDPAPEALEVQEVEDTQSTEDKDSKDSDDTITKAIKVIDSFLGTRSVARFKDASWFSKVSELEMVIAGQGGIGSNASLQISRLHPKFIYLYDDDYVEEVNLAGQFFSMDDLGKKKVAAITDNINKFSNYYKIAACPNIWSSSMEGHNIMIGCFDNMPARKNFIYSWKNHLNMVKDKSECLFIDGRLSINEIQVFCFLGNDDYNIERYEKDYLFYDADAEQTLCSLKQTSFCANMIGSLITNLIVNYAQSKVVPLSANLPFKTYYNSDTMYFKTEN